MLNYALVTCSHEPLQNALSLLVEVLYINIPFSPAIAFLSVVVILGKIRAWVVDDNSKSAPEFGTSVPMPTLPSLIVITEAKEFRVDPLVEAGAVFK